jgi:LCP family protein required for cell wall assembly
MRSFDALNNKPNNYPPIYTQNNPSPAGGLTPTKRKRRRRWIKWVVLLVIIVGALIWGGNSILSKVNKIFTNKQSIFTRVGRFISSDDKPLIGEDTGTVNILLLGIGGPGHEGPNLTDTMIVASIDVKTKDVVMISVPRDFMVTLPGRGYQKINAAYAYAELDQENSGGQAAIDAVEKITGLDIPYFAVIDFKGFVKAVDRVGGVDITVDRTFTDAQYPNYNYGYLPPQTFTKGEEHMDGERALIFARSRHGNNGEASDFARSERQKKVILALKDKAAGLNVTDLKTLNGLLNDFTENFRTNLEPYELQRLAGIAQGISDNSVVSFSLEPQAGIICDGSIDLRTGRPPVPEEVPLTDEELAAAQAEAEANGEDPALVPTTKSVNPSSTAYVVIPCAGKTVDDIKTYLTTAPQLAKLKKEDAVIEIQNASGKSSVLDKWRTLANQGYNIKITPYAGRNLYDHTVLYDNSKGAKPLTIDWLKSKIAFTASDVPFYDSPKSDIVIILGKDAIPIQ